MEKRIIIYRSRRHSYSFYNNVGVDIQREISLKAAKLPADSDILGTLKEISEYDYVLPKKYNQIYSMTRYYEYVFMSPEQIEKLPSPEILFEQHFSDGKIVAVVSDNRTDYSKELSERLKDDRIVVLVTKAAFDNIWYAFCFILNTAFDPSKMRLVGYEALFGQLPHPKK